MNKKDILNFIGIGFTILASVVTLFAQELEIKEMSDEITNRVLTTLNSDNKDTGNL